jgi:hypothetical protein
MPRQKSEVLFPRKFLKRKPFTPLTLERHKPIGAIKASGAHKDIIDVDLGPGVTATFRKPSAAVISKKLLRAESRANFYRQRTRALEGVVADQAMNESPIKPKTLVSHAIRKPNSENRTQTMLKINKLEEYIGKEVAIQQEIRFLNKRYTLLQELKKKKVQDTLQILRRIALQSKILSKQNPEQRNLAFQEAMNVRADARSQLADFESKINAVLQRLQYLESFMSNIVQAKEQLRSLRKSLVVPAS